MASCRKHYSSGEEPREQAWHCTSVSHSSAELGPTYPQALAHSRGLGLCSQIPRGFKATGMSLMAQAAKEKQITACKGAWELSPGCLGFPLLPAIAPDFKSKGKGIRPPW